MFEREKPAIESLGTEARMKRPERAEAPSPGQHPGYNDNQ